jgi:hypothetical protein
MSLYAHKHSSDQINFAESSLECSRMLYAAAAPLLGCAAPDVLMLPG